MRALETKPRMLKRTPCRITAHAALSCGVRHYFATNTLLPCMRGIFQLM